MKAQQVTGNMINYFRDVKKEYEEAEKNVRFYESEYNDLTHALELTNFNASEGYKLAKELKQNRKNRREAKDIMNELNPLYMFMQSNSRFLQELKKVNTEVIKITQKKDSRKYHVRARADMQEAFDKSNEVML